MGIIARLDKTKAFKQKLHLYETRKSHASFTEDLQTFLGAIFYPKDIKAALLDSDTQGKASAKLVHKTLYSFSNNNLHTLMRESAAFRYILTDSLNK